MGRKGRWEEVQSVLTLVHGKGDPNHPLVKTEMQDIREICEFEAKNSDVTYWELFKPNMINRTHIGLFMQIWSQLTGMNVMMVIENLFLLTLTLLIIRQYYITYVFLMAGKTQSTLLLSSRFV